MHRAIVLIAAAALLLGAGPASAEPAYGHFVGKFVAEFGADGRKVKLIEPYGFVDPDGMHWDVPAGYETDGASVPAALWAFYPPFTGAYRSAAVIHDYYCDSKTRSTSWAFAASCIQLRRNIPTDRNPALRVPFDATNNRAVDSSNAVDGSGNSVL